MEILLVVLLVSFAAGSAAALAVRAAPRADPASAATRAIGDELGRRGDIRRFLRSRIDRGVATGLVLTLALGVTIAAGIVLGILVYMIRAQTGLVGLDRAVEQWSNARMTSLSITALQAVTALGSTVTIVALGIVTAGIAVWRWRSRAIPLFLALVIGGQLLLADLIKSAVHRARPDLRPLAGFSGPSFASGHATAAAATFAAIALVLGRDGSSRRRVWLAGIAVALAVAVACSRVFLGVHWLSDVIGGLILGWTWFALCAVAFGGRLMRFAAPERAAVAQPASSVSRHPAFGEDAAWVQKPATQEGSDR